MWWFLSHLTSCSYRFRRAHKVVATTGKLETSSRGIVSKPSRRLNRSSIMVHEPLSLVSGNQIWLPSDPVMAPIIRAKRGSFGFRQHTIEILFEIL